MFLWVRLVILELSDRENTFELQKQPITYHKACIKRWCWKALKITLKPAK